jgi:hypothetical protein
MALAVLGSAAPSDGAAPKQAFLTIDDVRTNEGSGQDATFRVRLSGTHDLVRVDYSTPPLGGSATGGDDCIYPIGNPGVPVGYADGLVDYESQSGYSLEFGASESVKEIPIEVCNDVRDEPDETFVIKLANAIGATIQDFHGQGTIVDDDPAPSLSIDRFVTAPEGVGQYARFTVELSAISGKRVTVSWLTVDGWGTVAGKATGGTCPTGGDYQAANLNPFPIAPGQPSATLYVPICDDAVREEIEHFEVRLSGAINATIQNGIGVGRIADNEPLPALSIVAPAKTGESSVAVFTVTLGGPSTTERVSVDFATAPGTATAGTTCLLGDYVTQTGTLSFDPTRGVTTQEIRVPICADGSDDPNETFRVALSNSRKATISQAVATATIR